jgi:carbon monoxide dehydrogenase subunit G
MDIEGTYTLQASPEGVWQSLGDLQLLLRALPEIERLTPIDDQRIAITLHLRHSLLRGVYSGIITLQEQQKPHYCRFVIESDGQGNPFSGRGVLELHRRNDTTVITYRGQVQIGKTETRLAQAVARGATRLLIQRLLTTLTCQLQTRSSERDAVPESKETMAETGVRKLHLPGGTLVILPSAPMLVAPLKEGFVQTLTQKVAHLLHLDNIDAEQTARWKKRARQIGVVSALLFLVWVGTRIPRRP